MASSDFISNEADLGPNWVEAPSRAPIVPGQPAPPPVGAVTPVIPSYLQGVLAPNFQHDTHFVDTELRTPSAPKFSLMPLGPQQNAISSAQINSAVRTTVASIPSTPAEVTGLTSIGLIMPAQYAVANSPLTENGTIDVSWVSEPFGTYLGVASNASAPSPDGIAAQTLASVTTLSTNYTTPSAADLVIYAACCTGNQSVAISSPGVGWTRLDSAAAGNTGFWAETFPTASTNITNNVTYTPGGSTTTPALSQTFCSFKTTGTPVVTELGRASGAIGNSTTITATVLANTTLVAIQAGDIPNNGDIGQPIIQFTDNKGNTWYPVVSTYIYAGTTNSNTHISVWYCPNPVTGSTVFSMSVGAAAGHANLLGNNNYWGIYSVTNLAPGGGIPTFKPIAASDINGVLGIAHGGTSSNLSGTGGTSQVLQQSSQGAAITVGQLDYPNLLGTSPATRYAGNNLTGNGWPFFVSFRDSTGQSGNQGATNFTNGPFGAGLYRVSVYMVVSQAATSSSTLPDSQIIFPDRDSGATITINVTPGDIGNTTSTFQQAIYILNLKNSSNIQFAWGQVTPYASSGATPMQFAYHAKVEFLG